MKISVKGRYALASMIFMGKSMNSTEYISVLNIAEKLGLSKIYAEQVFSLLKRAELVTSIKGAQGGYRITKELESITAYDILSAVENSLFDVTEGTTAVRGDIESTMKDLIFVPLDDKIKEILSSVTLAKLINEAERYSGNHMFYI